MRRASTRTTMLPRIMNMAREMKRWRVVKLDSAAADSDDLSSPFGPDPREANSDHLSPLGREPAPDLIRGRPEGPGEGGSSFPAKSAPPLPSGARENATAGSQCADGAREKAAAP